MQSQAQHHAANNRVAVLGAGVIGLSCAYQLQRQGYQVTLYDPKPPGSQCSFGNAGHFATEQVFPMACSSLLPKLPKMLISQRSAPAYCAHIPTTATTMACSLWGQYDAASLSSPH